MLTYEQALKSDALRQHLAAILADKNLQMFLFALQLEALPNNKRQLVVPQTPGLHPDSVTTQDTRFWQGWTAAINALRDFPTGKTPSPGIEDEEMFAHDPTVQAIDKELAAKKGTQ